jgi:glycosyltransferase involved in cell wall biosynthesis
MMRAAIVTGVCVKNDAISDAVRATQQAIGLAFGVVPTIYCYTCDFPDVPHRVVQRSIDILLDPDFSQLELIIFHFGIYYELFNSIFFHTRARRIVRYHNITPAAFASEQQLPTITRSLRQRANLAVADCIWADSQFNRGDLIELGLDPERITVEPLPLKFKEEFVGKKPRPGSSVELLFVGRIARSKGVAELIEVAKAASNVAPTHLSIAGNIRFSDSALVETLVKQIIEYGLEEQITFEGTVSDARLAELYSQADIFVLPSYHEGFCVPVIEALHSRCVPLTYEAGNLKNLVGPLGVTVPTGDKAAFIEAVTQLVSQFFSGRPEQLRLAKRQVSWRRYNEEIEQYLKGFSFESFTDRTRRRVEQVLSRSPDLALHLTD